MPELTLEPDAVARCTLSNHPTYAILANGCGVGNDSGGDGGDDHDFVRNLTCF